MANYWEGPPRTITPSSFNYSSVPATSGGVNPYPSSYYAYPAPQSAASGYRPEPNYQQSSYPSAQYPTQLLWDASQGVPTADFPGALPLTPPQPPFQFSPDQSPGTIIGGIGGQSYQFQTPTPPPEHYSRPSSAFQMPFQQLAPWSHSPFPSQHSVVQTYQAPLAAPQYLSPTALLDNPYPFWLNLAYNICSPCRFTEQYSVVPLSAIELAQPATDPFFTRLSVVVDELLTYQPGAIDILAAFGPIITVRDVAETIHWRMQRPIDYDDWNKLTPQDQSIVTEFYRTRTRDRVQEAELGVKWVDMLKGKWVVRGLRNEQGNLKVVLN
ncbi:hypothetical protein CPB85DRAFT_1446726 [Mucidula mucida]|nr:hypothetical protein CPB85DRAFT_1446726 [Mucidula mucida]